MKAIFVTALAIGFAAPAFSAPIDGTWKADVKSAKMPTKPEVYLLKAGTFTCATCVPKIVVSADGNFHKVSGHPYFDEMSVAEVDKRTIKQETRKGGKLVFTETDAVSPNGKSFVSIFTDTGGSSGTPVTGKAVMKRVGAAPAGAHAYSGSWIRTNDAQFSDSGLTFMFSSRGDSVSFKSPTGSAYTAKLNGPKSPVTGDPGWSAVRLKGTPNAIVETDYRGDKAIGIQTMTLRADGKTMKVRSQDLLHATSMSYTAIKQ